MLNTRLLRLMGDSQKYIVYNVLFNWFNLLAQIFGVMTLSKLLNSFIEQDITTPKIIKATLVVVFCLVTRFMSDLLSSKFSYLASKNMKRYLRDLIYEKLLRLGISYDEHVATSEIVQISCEGVEQLETYFGKYVPQFFYSMIAPITLFVAFFLFSWRTALVLLCCVPLIPISIISVSKVAKKLLNKYWATYTTLGDSFLENIQGLTALKIYQADEFKNEEMNIQAEKFRKITMRVLFMQLSSIIIMDLVAYGGAGAGIVTTIIDYKAGRLGLGGTFALIVLSAEFFLPLRALGSFFHVAMNGMSASTKIFRLLDLPEGAPKTSNISNVNITAENVSYSYDESKKAVSNVNMEIPEGKFVAIVGESGCGKSTFTSLLNGTLQGYEGSIKVGGVELKEVNENSLMSQISTVKHNSYIFKGSFRSNLKLGNPKASDEEIENALSEVNLKDFVMSRGGLDSAISEKGSNLSGGQCQRLALARALLSDARAYILDEATSNIDAESEGHIMSLVHRLAGKKTIVLISHRLANVVDADEIVVMRDGNIVERGTHEQLMATNGVYNELYTKQHNLEEGVYLSIPIGAKSSPLGGRFPPNFFIH